MDAEQCREVLDGLKGLQQSLDAAYQSKDASEFCGTRDTMQRTMDEIMEGGDYQSSPSGFRQEMEQLQIYFDKMKISGAEMMLAAELSNVMSSCRRLLNEFNTAVFTQKNGEAARKAWEQLTSEIQMLLTNSDKYEQNAEAQKLMEEYNWLGQSAKEKIEALINEAQSKAELAKCQPKLKALNKELAKPKAKQDGSTLKSLWQQLHDASYELVNKEAYHQFPEVSSFLTEYKAHDAQVPKIAEDLITQKEMCDRVQRWNAGLKPLRGAQEKKNGKALRTAWTALQEAARPLQGEDGEKYKHFAEVIELLKQHTTLEENVPQEATDYINRDEAAGILEKIERPIKHLEIYVEKGDMDNATVEIEELKSHAGLLLNDPNRNYRKFPEVDEFVTKYETLSKLNQNVSFGEKAVDGSKPDLAKNHWEKDAKKCQICEKEFSLKRRRHHCRKCGINSCDKCCPKPSLTDSKRVCIKCMPTGHSPRAHSPKRSGSPAGARTSPHNSFSAAE